MAQAFSAKEANRRSALMFYRSAPNFDKSYIFGKNNTVVIQCQSPKNYTGDKIKGQNLRVKPGNLGQLDWTGEDGPFAQWAVEKNDNIVMFKSLKSGKYLRIREDGGVDVGGTGGPWCKFKYHLIGDKHDGTARLESAKLGTFLAIGQAAPAFSKPYGFAMNKVIVMKHVGGANLNTVPNTEKMAGTGALGSFARFAVELQDNGAKARFKNVANGKYLRIKGNGEVDCGGGQGPFTLFKVNKQGGNKVKLESNKFAGKWLNFNPNQKAVGVGAGGPWCVFECMRKD